MECHIVRDYWINPGSLHWQFRPIALAPWRRAFERQREGGARGLSACLIEKFIIKQNCEWRLNRRRRQRSRRRRRRSRGSRQQRKKLKMQERNGASSQILPRPRKSILHRHRRCRWDHHPCDRQIFQSYCIVHTGRKSKHIESNQSKKRYSIKPAETYKRRNCQSMTFCV